MPGSVQDASPRGGGGGSQGNAFPRAGGGTPDASPRNPGSQGSPRSPRSPRFEEPKEPTGADGPAADGFQPEVLHVRALILEERRSCARQLLSVKAELNRKQGMLEFMDCDDLHSSGSEHTLDTVEEELHRMDKEAKRLRYTERLLELRQRRLLALNPVTFSELPQQLLSAARDGDASYMQFGAEAKVSLDVQDDQGMTPLIAACIANKVSTVRTLLELRADSNLRDQNGATCAHYAVQLERAHVVLALLEVKAGAHWDSLTVKDTFDRTALDYAKQVERGPIRQLLRSHIGGGVHMLLHITKGQLLDELDGDWRSNGGNWFTLCPCSNASTMARDRERIATKERKKQRRRLPG